MVYSALYRPNATDLYTHWGWSYLLHLCTYMEVVHAFNFFQSYNLLFALLQL